MTTDPGISDDYLPMDGKRLLERLHTALNTRDLEDLMRCFQVDYESNRPSQPGRTFTGVGPVRQAWEQIFNHPGGFRADLVSSAFEASTIWSEWHWHTLDDDKMDLKGVIIFGVEDGLLAWSKMYMPLCEPGKLEPVI